MNNFFHFGLPFYFYFFANLKVFLHFDEDHLFSSIGILKKEWKNLTLYRTYSCRRKLFKKADKFMAINLKINKYEWIKINKIEYHSLIHLKEKRKIYNLQIHTRCDQKISNIFKFRELLRFLHFFSVILAHMSVI